MKPRHFLTGEELDSAGLAALLERAAELKTGRTAQLGRDNGAGRTIALIFERPSTRTRVSFEVAVTELGAAPLVLRADELQLSRGESIRDTAIVLSRYLHAIVIRSGSHERVVELAEHADVPVINALTPEHHPCQALADLLTLRERFGELRGLKLAFVGDGANNVARSLAIACRTAGVELRVAAPAGYQLEDGLGAKLTDDPAEAVAGADAVYTDVWVSMGDEAEAETRRADLSPYQINSELLAKAAGRAVVLHCLPAHPGEEITEEVLYGERSAVWDQAENRLHAQKALVELLTLEHFFKTGYGLWAAKDVDGMVAMAHPDIEFNPAPEFLDSESLRGPDAVREWFQQMIDTVNLSFDLDSMVLRCDRDLVRIEATARIVGAGSGVPSNAQFRHEWRLREGRTVWLDSHILPALSDDDAD